MQSVQNKLRAQQLCNLFEQRGFDRETHLRKKSSSHSSFELLRQDIAKQFNNSRKLFLF